MEPTLGMASEYASNPYLLSTGERAVSDEAILLDVPARYDLDAAHFALEPSLRYSDSGTYASLASNYFHLNASASFAGDLGALSFTGGRGRDSSLYQNGVSSNGVGVRMDSGSAGMDWQRQITERSFLAVDASWNRVRYGQSTAATGLVDYRYVSVGPSVSIAVDERDKFRVSAGAGQYLALDGITESKNYSLQLGLDRQLTEIWTLTTSAGYARSNNSEKIFYGPIFIGSIEYGPFLLGTIESEQKGPVYSASLIRQGERFSVTASASRAFRPSGFEFLSRADTAEVDLKHAYSERWKFGAKATYQKTATPSSNGANSSLRYLSGQLSAEWHWTPTWVVALNTTWVSVKYVLPPISAQSSGVSLEISRQFLRIDL
jgi:hypothetical protein